MFSVTAACLAILITVVNNQTTPESVYRTTPVVRGPSLFNALSEPFSEATASRQLFRDNLNQWEADPKIPEFRLPQVPGFLDDHLGQQSRLKESDSNQPLYLYQGGEYYRIK